MYLCTIYHNRHTVSSFTISLSFPHASVSYFPCTCTVPLMSVWSLDEVEHNVQELVPSFGVRMTGYHT